MKKFVAVLFLYDSSDSGAAGKDENIPAPEISCKGSCAFFKKRKPDRIHPSGRRTGVRLELQRKIPGTFPCFTTLKAEVK